MKRTEFMPNIDWLVDETTKILDLFKDYLNDSAGSLQRISAEVDMDEHQLYNLKEKFRGEAIEIVKSHADAIQKAINTQIERQNANTTEIIMRLHKIIGPQRLKELATLSYTLTEKQLQNLRDKLVNK